MLLYRPSCHRLSYVQVSEYARRFNLSASLAASITNLSAWLSAILLLAILAVVAHAQHTLTTAQATASLPDLVAAIRWPLLAISLTTAAALLISIPVSANLAKKSQQQGPQHLQATAAGRGKVTSAGVPPETSLDGAVSNSAAPGGTVGSVASNGESSSKPVNDASPAASDGGKEGPAEQPGEDTISEPSTLPSNYSFASEADSPPQTLSEMVGSGDGESGASSSTTDGHDAPEQQLPGAGPNSNKRFFRDIESDCLPACRQRQFGPKLGKFGMHRIARMQRPWLARNCMHRASFWRDSIWYTRRPSFALG